MNGYIINFAKRLNNNYSAQENTSIQENGVYSTLGFYDYVEVLECEKLSQCYFMDQKNSKLNNIGYAKRQRIHLYNIEEQSFDSRLHNEIDGYQRAKQKILLTDTVSDIGSKNSFIPLYFIVTLMELDYFSHFLYSPQDYTNKTTGHPRGTLYWRRTLIKKIKTRILEKAGSICINNQRINLKIEVMPTLNHGEVAIIWLTNCFDLPDHILKTFRYAQYSCSNTGPRQLFQNVRSSISILDYNQTNAIWLETDRDKQLRILLNLSFDSINQEQAFLKGLPSNVESKALNSFYGGRTSMMDIGIRDLPFEYYSENNKVSISDVANGIELIKTNVLIESCKERDSQIISHIDNSVYPCGGEVISLTDAAIRNICIHSSNADSSLSEFENKTNILIGTEIASEIDSFFRRHPYFKESIKRMWMDFQSCYGTLQNPVWKSDIAIQYTAVLTAIEIIIKDIKSKLEIPDSAKNQIVEINNIIQAMQQTFNHINQGGLVYDAPGSSLPYSGSFRSIIWAYNGILKSILAMIYTTRRTTSQRKIIPIITFSAVSAIESQYYSCDNDNQDTILVIYKLPTIAFYKIIPYTAYLLHESHHYSAPTSREVRNQVVFTMYISLYLKAIYTSKITDCINVQVDALHANTDEKIGPTIIDNAIESYVDADYNAIIDSMDRSYNISSNAPLDEYYQFLESDFIKIATGENILNKALTVKLYDMVCSSLKKNYEKLSDEDISKINENLNKIIPKRLSEIELGDIRDVFYSTLHGIHEACCDLFMIQTMNMDINGYLDFFSDHLYTGRLALDIHDAEDTANPGFVEYSTRLGIIVDYYISKINEANKANKHISINDLLNKWEEHNENIIKIRKKENRDYLKIGYRLSLKNTYLSFYEKYNSIRKNIKIKNLELIKIGDFHYIWNEMFQVINNIPKEEFDKHFNQLQSYTNRFNQIQTIVEKKRERDFKLMRLYINMIEHYSVQTKDWQTLWDLNNTNARLETMKPGSIKYQSTPLKVYRIVDRHVWTKTSFFNTMENLAKTLGNNNPDNYFWYRGEKQADYNLTPSLYRNYKKGNTTTNNNTETNLDGKSGILQRVYLNEFIMRVSASNEINLAEIKNDADWLALLQHYNGQTHFLDWSENLFSAMFFMLKPLFLHEIDTKNLEYQHKVKLSKKNGASLYIFDPKRFNMIILESILNIRKSRKECFICKNKQLFEERLSYSVPNLSRPEPENIFSSYLLGDQIICKKILTTNPRCKECPLRYPIAIHTNFSNRRISAQAGTFVAFSVHAIGNELDYDLLNLQQIILDKNPKIMPFLYKMIIHEPALSELFMFMKSIGIKLTNTYPEMENQGRLLTTAVHP